MNKPNQPIPIEATGKSIKELVSLGCKFVLEGDVFLAMATLLEGLLKDETLNTEGRSFLTRLQLALIQTSNPVFARQREVKDDEPKIKVVRNMPKMAENS